MHLTILLPDQMFLDEEVGKVVAEAQDGSFCLLPKHIDFAASLVPGILSFHTTRGEQFVAVDEGVLVKHGPEVRVSTRNAIRSDDLEGLKHAVRESLRRLDERERQARAALARLEADIVRGFAELQGTRP